MFGNDRNNQGAPVGDDQPGMPPNNGQQQYNDNGMSPVNDQAMQQSVDNLMSQGAPQMDNGLPQQNDYIMTDQQQPQQPVSDYQVPVTVNTAPVEAMTPVAASPSLTMGSDDLASIKQQALQQLSPIIDHLEQSPEEKFHITMMMLQATDDQNLVRSAYEAAKSIVDEKKRAKALLDVVNEITYFTQHKKSE